MQFQTLNDHSLLEIISGLKVLRDHSFLSFTNLFETKVRLNQYILLSTISQALIKLYYSNICLTASDRDCSYVDLQLKNLQLQKFSVIFLVKLYKIMSRICYFSITSLKISLVVKNVP